MADPLVSDVLADARVHLGDDAGEQFTDVVLTPFFGQAFREVYDIMIRWKLPLAKRTSPPITLAANATSLDPETAGLPDLDEPNALYERIGTSGVWAPMTSVGELPQYPSSGQNVYWKWENGTFYFIGATVDTQLKICYSASGNPPSTSVLNTTVGIDNSRNFLAFRTASLAAAGYDMDSKAAYLRNESFGPSGQADGTGGALRGLILPMLLEKQKRHAVPGTFRPRRNNFTRTYW